MTPAEKMKRYREKLKKDPIRYEEYKNKDLQRMKIKTKNISEMTEIEKDEIRKKWREQKKKQKLKKVNQENKIVTDNETTAAQSISINNVCSTKYCLKIKKLKKVCLSLAAKNKILQKRVDTLRKSIYRMKKRNLQENEEWKKKVMKMQAREEVLECAIRNTYSNTKNQKEKRVLKRIIHTDVVRRTRSKTYVANLFGLKGRIRTASDSNQLNTSIKKEILFFFLRDDFSRSTSGKKECRSHKKEKQQIRYLTDTLQNVYNIYKAEGGRYSFMTFYRYKPFYVLSPNVQNRDSCQCIKHSNMNLLFSALVKYKLIPTTIKTVTDVLSKLSCDLNAFDCMYGRCANCKDSSLSFELQENLLPHHDFNRILVWQQWERVNFNYEKIEGGKLSLKTTKKTIKQLKQGTIEDLINNFKGKIASFKIHYFN